MLKQRHRRDATEHDIPAELEQQIRADERRRVLAERGEREDDWRTTPPPPGDPPVADPSTTSPPQAAAPVREEPRGWDVRDDATERGPAEVREERTTMATAEPDVVQEDTVTERGFSPGQVLILLAGAVTLAIGLIAIVRTGLDGPLSDPVETVLWWDHTALLGLFEVGAGVLLILGGLHPAMRWLGGLVGLAMIVGGVLILGELDWTMDELGAERDFGWAPIVVGAVAVIGAAIPRIRRTRQVTTTTARPEIVH
jgi:hypothetical protein